MPIWCVGALGRPKSMARALRWDGVHPPGRRRRNVANRTRRGRRAIRDTVGDRDYDIVIEGTSSEHSPAAWADAGATWWIESMWDAMREIDAVLAANDRLLQGPPSDLTRVVPDQPDRQLPSTARRPRPVGTSPTCGETVATRSPNASRTAADAAPDDARTRGREFDRRADGVAATLLDAGRRASRTRSPTTSTTAPSTSSRSSPRSRPGWCRSTPTTATPTTSSSYLWDNADAVAVVFHGTFADAVRSGPRPGARRRARGCGSTTAAGPAPTGRSPYEAAAAQRRRGDVVAAVGSQRRRPAPPLHRRHHRHAQGRDVAPGRPVRRARRERRKRRSPPGQDLDAVARHGSPSPGPRNLPARAADARHRAVQRDQQPDARRRRSSRIDRPPLRRRSSCSTRSSASGSTRSSIVGDAFAKPMLRALDAEPGPLGHLVAAR